ncbi:MAG TPA: class I SAM-dependent methyltransferase [Vicinamibacterales bacterium]|jgi:SAM-dependent methyltransferase
MWGVTQNIYDEDGFFAGYSQLPRSRRGLEGAPEWQSLRAMLPEEMAGLRVLDLGCGFGWFCRWALDRGARSVTGIDVSKKMLARAQQESDPAIRYIEADLDSLTIAHASADLIYSSLAFHYVTNLEALVVQIAGALPRGGQLVFSVEHPMVTAPLHQGWSEDSEGAKAWPVNHYLEDGPRTTNWLAPRVVKQHRSMATYLNMLLRHAFTLTHLEEWGPTEAQSAEDSSLLDERHRPTFLLVSTVRR